MQEQLASPAPNGGGKSLGNLRRTLVYKTTSSPTSIREGCDRLKELDKDAETKKPIWTGVTVVGVIVGIVCFFIASATQNSVLFFGMMLGFAAAVFGLVMRVKVGRLDLDDRRYSLVSQLVRYLAADMRSDGLLDLTIDFNSYHNRRYQTGHAGGATSYAVPWLTLKGTIADGNRFRFGVTQVVKRKERRKRKYTKVKESFREKVRLTILANKKAYARLERMERLLQGAKQPSGLQLRRVSSNANRIDILALTACQRRVQGRNTTQSRNSDPSTTDHHALLGLFLACYHCLGQCRIRKKGE